MADGARDLSIRFLFSGEPILIRLPHNMPGTTSAVSGSALSSVNGTNYHPCVAYRFSRLDSI